MEVPDNRGTCNHNHNNIIWSKQRTMLNKQQIIYINFYTKLFCTDIIIIIIHHQNLLELFEAASEKSYQIISKKPSSANHDTGHRHPLNERASKPTTPFSNHHFFTANERPQNLPIAESTSKLKLHQLTPSSPRPLSVVPPGAPTSSNNLPQR